MFNFGLMGHLNAKIAEWELQDKRNKEQYERACWDHQMLRGPMIEADIDWRVPQDYRPMVASDIGLNDEGPN